MNVPVTKACLRGELRALKTSLLLWLFSMLVVFTAVIGAIATWG